MKNPEKKLRQKEDTGRDISNPRVLQHDIGGQAFNSSQLSKKKKEREFSSKVLLKRPLMQPSQFISQEPRNQYNQQEQLNNQSQVSKSSFNLKRQTKELEDGFRKVKSPRVQNKGQNFVVAQNSIDCQFQANLNKDQAAKITNAICNMKNKQIFDYQFMDKYMKNLEKHNQQRIKNGQNPLGSPDPQLIHGLMQKRKSINKIQMKQNKQKMHAAPQTQILSSHNFDSNAGKSKMMTDMSTVQIKTPKEKHGKKKKRHKAKSMKLQNMKQGGQNEQSSNRKSRKASIDLGNENGDYTHKNLLIIQRSDFLKPEEPIESESTILTPCSKQNDLPTQYQNYSYMQLNLNNNIVKETGLMMAGSASSSQLATESQTLQLQSCQVKAHSSQISQNGMPFNTVDNQTSNDYGYSILKYGNNTVLSAIEDQSNDGKQIIKSIATLSIRSQRESNNQPIDLAEEVGSIIIDDGLQDRTRRESLDADEIISNGEQFINFPIENDDAPSPISSIIERPFKFKNDISQAVKQSVRTEFDIKNSIDSPTDLQNENIGEYECVCKSTDKGTSSSDDTPFSRKSGEMCTSHNEHNLDDEVDIEQLNHFNQQLQIEEEEKDIEDDVEIYEDKKCSISNENDHYNNIPSTPVTENTEKIIIKQGESINWTEKLRELTQDQDTLFFDQAYISILLLKRKKASRKHIIFNQGSHINGCRSASNKDYPLKRISSTITPQTFSPLKPRDQTQSKTPNSNGCGGAINQPRLSQISNINAEYVIDCNEIFDGISSNVVDYTSFADSIYSDNVPIVSSKNWAIIDPKKGDMLWGKEDKEMREVASLTKIMTAYVTIKTLSQLKIDPCKTYVNVSRKASTMPGTSAFLQWNMKICFYDLLHALMLPSGNDAAIVLSENIGLFLYKLELDCKKQIPSKLKDLSNDQISYHYFIKEMNKTAKQLNLNNTQYSNPHGLQDKSNKSCAADVGKIASLAMKEELFRDVVKKRNYKSMTFKNDGSRWYYNWCNTNQLLNENSFLGIKTGITPTAGPCLSIFLQYGNLSLVTVVLNSKTLDHRWGEISRLSLWGMNKLIQRQKNQQQRFVKYNCQGVDRRFNRSVIEASQNIQAKTESGQGSIKQGNSKIAKRQDSNRKSMVFSRNSIAQNLQQ